MKKADVFDYLSWRGDLTFAQSAFNEIDSLILSVFAYLDYSFAQEKNAVQFRDAVAVINRTTDKLKFDGPNIMMRSVIELASAAAAFPRFRDMEVSHFFAVTDEEKEIQFAAVTFLLSDKTAFLSFRGTDNTLVGWKEDFNMCFTQEIPSQKVAAKYAVLVAEDMDLPLRLGGHSKGGNLAIYAGTRLPLEQQDNIVCIYNHDGPGFSKEFLKRAGYLNIRGKIRSFVPESSIVGVLMEHDVYTTIRSSSPSLLQHNPFSWMVLGTHFVYDARSFSGKRFEKAINSWIKSMTAQEREELVENIYGILSSSEAKTIDDLDNAKMKSFLSMHKTFREMGIKKQTQLMLSLSKVFFNNEMFINNENE